MMQSYMDMGAHYHALHMQLTLAAGEGTQSCGEDAYFISRRKNMMGVSDGVSAWSAYGLGNSGYLAFYLMSNARVAAEKRDITDTIKLVNESFEAVWDLHDNKLVTIPNGSATITALKLNTDPITQQQYVQYSNLGDCMVMILRPERVIVENTTTLPLSSSSSFPITTTTTTTTTSTTLRITHVSNKLYSFHEHARGIPVPLQLVFYPAQGRKLSTEQSGGVETQKVEVQEDDIIIMATDGLWDNLMNEDARRIVEDIVNAQSRTRDSQGEVLPLNPNEIASRLVEEAFRMNLKPDDITAVVGIVKKM